MWKVKRMNRARIVVLTIALGAGGVAAYLASGSDSKPPPPTEPVVQLQTVDVLVANSDIGLGQTVTPNDMAWEAGATPARHQRPAIPPPAAASAPTPPRRLPVRSRVHPSSRATRSVSRN